MLEQIISALDFLFLPLTFFQNHISILLISILLTTIIFVINRLFVNKNLVNETKRKMEEIRESLTQAQKEGNKENIEKFLNELMKTNTQYMRQTFKTLIISLIIISFFLPWLNYRYQGLTVAALPFNLPLIGSSLNWLYWYILISLAVGWVIRKIFGE